MSTGRKRGPKPKPAELIEITGDRSNHHGKEKQPKPDIDQRPLGHAPKGSSDAFRRVWNRVKRECPWLKKADSMVVTAFCNSWIEMDTAHKYLMAQIGTPSGAVNPRVLKGFQTTLDHARAACVTLMEQIGATPTSRRRIREYGKEKSKSPSDRFLGGSKAG